MVMMVDTTINSCQLGWGMMVETIKSTRSIATLECEFERKFKMIYAGERVSWMDRRHSKGKREVNGAHS